MAIKDNFISANPTVLFIAVVDRQVQIFFKDDSEIARLNFTVNWSSREVFSYDFNAAKSIDEFEIPTNAVFYLSEQKKLEYKTVDYRHINKPSLRSAEYTNIFCYDMNNLGIAKDVKMAILSEVVDAMPEDIAESLLAISNFNKLYNYQKSIIAASADTPEA